MDDIENAKMHNIARGSAKAIKKVFEKPIDLPRHFFPGSNKFTTVDLVVHLVQFLGKRHSKTYCIHTSDF